MKVLLPNVFALLVTASALSLQTPVAGHSGEFVKFQQADSTTVRAFVAGPEKAKAAVLIIHDYFGLSDSTLKSVERLGSLGYRAMTIDLYGGELATTDEEAAKLMQSQDRKVTDRLLQAGLDYLKWPGRKIATLGFSMGEKNRSSQI